MKHTKEKWVIDGQIDGNMVVYLKAGKKILATIATLEDGVNNAARNKEAKANAQLIAAAPDLLEACKAQYEAIDRLFALLILKNTGFYPSKSGQPWKAIKQGRQAITEAEQT